MALSKSLNTLSRTHTAERATVEAGPVRPFGVYSRNDEDGRAATASIVEMFKYRTVRPAQFPMHLYRLDFPFDEIGRGSIQQRALCFVSFETGETLDVT